MSEIKPKCCATCSHLNSESECRCPNSVLYKQFIFDVRGEGRDCPQHEHDESREG